MSDHGPYSDFKIFGTADWGPHRHERRFTGAKL